MSVISRDLTRVLGSTALSLSLAAVISSVMVSHGVAAEPDPYSPPITIGGSEEMELPDGKDVNYQGGGSGVSAITIKDGDGKLTGTNADISSNGIGPAGHSLAAGIRAGVGSAVKLTGGSVSATGSQYTRGILGSGSGTIITTSGTDISTIGNDSHAVHAFEGATAAITGGTVSTIGSDSFGLYSQKGSSVTAQNVTVETGGTNGFGAFTYGSNSFLELIGGSITTKGTKGHGVVAGLDSSIKLTDTVINTSGSSAWGIVADQTNTSVVATNVNISTKGGNAYGVNANGKETDTVSVTLEGGKIETNGARAYGLLSADSATISSSATILTHGASAHGVQAGANGSTADGSDGSRITLNSGSSVSTEGNDAFGLHAIDGGAIEGTVNVSTKGVNGFGAFAESYSTIELAGGSISTEGVSSHGLLANNDRKTDKKNPDPNAEGGILSATNTAIITSGDNAAGALAKDGGAITLVGGSIATSGQNASALQIVNSGTIDVTGTTLASANAATVNVVLDTAGANAEVTLGNGTVATQNNGTLLRVNRSQAGDDGVVQFTLGAGSTSQGDILDDDTETGGTDVTLEEGASWTGLLSGVRHFSGFQGGSVVFDDVANISGNLHGVGTSYSFSDLGGTIGGDVNLTSGSSTIGGTIDNRIVVEQNVSVDQTSVLGGNWDIKKNLNNSGILSPGNSIGRVTVGEDLKLSSSSVYQVELDQNGDADLVTVVGTANLDGVVVVSPLNGFQINSPYTILTAGERNGEFQSAEFANSSAFLDARLAYRSTDVTLSVERNATSFGSVAQTRNQTAVAEALDLLPLSNAVANSIILSSADSAQEAFTQLSGDTHASIKTGLIDTANLTTDTINNRLRAAFEGVAAKDAPVLSFSQSPKGSAPQPFDAVSPVSSEYSVWASGFGSWIDRDGNANTGGLKTSTGGFLSGVDVGVASGWRLGVVGGYSQTDLDAKGRFASATSDNWHLGIYGGNQWGPIGLRAGLVHTWNNIDSSRSVAYPGFSDSLDADYDARTLQAFGELGYRIDAASASFEPFANLSHVRLRTDGFNENGGAAALSVDSETTNTTFTTVGLRASAPLTLGTTTANLKGTLGWRHAYGDITPESTQFLAGSNAFTVEGVAIAKDAALVEAGFDLAITESATFGVSYIGQFGDGTTQNGFNASLNVKF